MNRPASQLRAHRDPAQRPVRRGQCAAVLEVIRNRGRAMTLKEIATALNLPDSTVSARLNTLRDDGTLDTYAERKCSINGLRKQTWFFAPTSPQRALFSEVA